MQREKGLIFSFFKIFVVKTYFSLRSILPKKCKIGLKLCKIYRSKPIRLMDAPFGLMDGGFELTDDYFGLIERKNL